MSTNYIIFYPLILVVLSTIRFDCHLIFRSIEIEDILIDRKLSSEFDSFELPISQNRP